MGSVLRTTRRTWKPTGAVALTLVVSACTGGGESAPIPTATPEIPPLVEGATLEPGTYALGLDRYRITLTVPAGWEGWAFGVIPVPEGPEPPTGRGIGFWIVDNIYADPCRWNRGLLDPPPEPSADALAAAIKAQWGRYATLPTTGELLPRDVSGGPRRAVGHRAVGAGELAAIRELRFPVAVPAR